MASLHFATLETPIGRLWLTGSPRGLREIQRGEHPDGLHGAHDPDALRDALRQLERYFAGELRRFDLVLDVADAAPFDVAVWAAARRVPYGATRSYGELAEEAGFPRAARAVGGAMARCPLSPVVPCHRIIRADGTLGGWGADPWVKRWLLDLEQEDRPARVARR